MAPKQGHTGDILDSERELVLRGEERYGRLCAHANKFAALLGTGTIKSIKADGATFALFYANVVKHYWLALFSALRLHHVQCQMNLRQVLENGTCAAYAIANPDPAGFADTRPDGTLDPSQALAKKRYAWLEQNFKAGLDGIKRQKTQINEMGAHANIVSAHQNFKADIERGLFQTPYFDFEDEFVVKTDLWQTANIAMGLLDLFYGVNLKVSAITYVDNWAAQFESLVGENNSLKDEMKKHPRLERFFRAT